MRAVPYDPVRPLYRALLVFGAVAILILAIGFGEFLYFEPPGQGTGLQATITGIYQYDPTTQKTFGPDRSAFTSAQDFAALVDWTSIPANITVDARWYDPFGTIVGRIGPGTPAQLAGQTTIPVGTPGPLEHHLPGRYIFVIERFNNGMPVEVLARRLVLAKP